MILEQALKDYQSFQKKGRFGIIYTSGLEMYTLGVGDSPPSFGSFGLSGIGSPRPLRSPSIIKPTPIGSAGSGFSILNDEKKEPYGIGRERTVDEETIAKILERVRVPETDTIHGFHLNYEETVPGLKKLGKLKNIHISLDDE